MKRLADDVLAPLPEEVELTAGFMAGGMGGVAEGFKKSHGEYMGVRWRWKVLGSTDISEARNVVFRRRVGAPAHTVDLLDRRNYLAYHGQFRDLQDTNPKLLTALLNECRKHDAHLAVDHLDEQGSPVYNTDGLIDLGEGWGRYWSYNGAWVEVLHWAPPPREWHEATVEDMHRWYGPIAPDVMFTTSDCKGNSRLLPDQVAQTLKYQALNSLVPRCIYLCMLAWPDDPVPVILNENVPGIMQRSKELLADMRTTAKGLDYLTEHKNHDAGEIAVGGLAQSRPRAFWIQRNVRKVPQLIYKPTKYPLRPIKDVINPLPMPWANRKGLDPWQMPGGPLHSLLDLDFVTWLRLALIRPGGDWKDIPAPGEWQLRTIDGRIVPAEAMCEAYVDKHGQQKLRWFAPDPEVYGRLFVAELLPGAKNYPDVRLNHQPIGNGKGAYWVQDETKPSGTVTADPSHRKSGGASSVSDPRLCDISCPDTPNRHRSHMHVVAADQPGKVVTGADHLANGSPSTADLRFGYREGRHHVQFCIQEATEPSATITTQTDVQTGAPLLSDIRLEFRENRHSTKYEVADSEDPGDVVTTSDRLGSGAPSVADIRVGMTAPKFNDAYNVLEGDDTGKTISCGTGPSGGGMGIADARLTHIPRDNSHNVTDPDREAPAIPGNCYVTTSNGPGAMADARLTREPKNGTMSVWEPQEAGKTITTHTDPNGDAPSLADVRMRCKPQNGTMGVIAWNGPAPTVIASLDVYAGQAAIEDVRVTIHNWPEYYPDFFILSPWNAWHRPLTDLELAVLQGFDPVDEDGKPFYLEGSRKDRRAAIGNAVPPSSAQGIANAIAPTLVVAKVFGPDAWMLSPTGEGVWVQDQEEQPEVLAGD